MVVMVGPLVVQGVSEEEEQLQEVRHRSPVSIANGYRPVIQGKQWDPLISSTSSSPSIFSVVVDPGYDQCCGFGSVLDPYGSGSTHVNIG